MIIERKKLANHNFFLFKKKIRKIQNQIKKKLAINSIETEKIFRRKGFNFSLKGYYGNLLDLNFVEFFENNLEFQDYFLITKKNKFYCIKKYLPNG